MIVEPYIYSFADQNTTAFKEVAIIRHPRVGEYAFGFITSSVTLQVVFGNYGASLSSEYICNQFSFGHQENLWSILKATEFGMIM